MHGCHVIIYSDIKLKTQLCLNSRNAADISLDTQNKTDLYQGGLRYILCFITFMSQSTVPFFLQKGIISVLRCLSLNEAHYSVPPNHFMWIYHVPTCINVNTDCAIPITKQPSRQKQLAKQSHAGICCGVTVSKSFVHHAKSLVLPSADNTKQVRAMRE